VLGVEGLHFSLREVGVDLDLVDCRDYGSAVEQRGEVLDHEVADADGSYLPVGEQSNRVVGEIELTGDALDLAGDGLTMIAYSAEPGSQAEDQLKLLAAWSATERAPGTSAAAELDAEALPPGTESR
jgi:hypothetical protein